MGYFIKKASQALTLFLIFFLFSQWHFTHTAYAFSYEDEVELGKKFNVLVRSKLPIVQDPEVVRYMDGIIKRLTKNMPPQPFQYTPSVVISPAVNAFATPGGYVFAYTGLILAMDDESELAGVMAHEIAHVSQRHIASRIENAQVISILSLLGMLAGAFLGGDAGAAAAMGSAAASQAAMLNYSRADENDADQVGLGYLIGSGYDPYGMPKAFEILSRRQWLLGGAIPPYLSTHPDLKDRIHTTTVRINRSPAAKQNIKTDNTSFKRIQSLLRARYSDPNSATIFFAKQKSVGGQERCLALMGLGILSSRQNRIQDAFAFFDEALQCNQADEIIVREAGRFHYLKGDKAKGNQLLHKAVSMDNKDLMALFFLARSQADAGNLQEAIDGLNYMLRFIPEDSEIHFFLARYYGQTQAMFEANLHMAYSALYENDARKVEKFFQTTSTLAQSPAQRSQVARFETLYKERKAFW